MTHRQYLAWAKWRTRPDPPSPPREPPADVPPTTARSDEENEQILMAMLGSHKMRR